MAWITSAGSPTGWITEITSSNAAFLSEVEAEIVVQIVDGHRVRHGVRDVGFGDAVLEGRRSQVHTAESYYESS